MNEITAEELLELYKKPFCSISDLMKITGKGKVTCYNLRTEILSKYSKNVLKSNLLPMKYVFKAFDIDPKQLRDALN